MSPRAGLIALTAVFLVVMGAVTVVVLGTLNRNQLNTEVRLASRESVPAMAAGADGFSAADLSLDSGRAGTLTPDPGSPSAAALLAMACGLAGLTWSQASARLGLLAPAGQPFSVSVFGQPAGPGAHRGHHRRRAPRPAAGLRQLADRPRPGTARRRST